MSDTKTARAKDLPAEDLTRLIETLGTAMRDLSVRIGPNKYAVPLSQGLDLGIRLFDDFASIVRERMAEAWDEGFQAACDETSILDCIDGPTDEANPYAPKAGE